MPRKRDVERRQRLVEQEQVWETWPAPAPAPRAGALPPDRPDNRPVQQSAETQELDELLRSQLPALGRGESVPVQDIVADAHVREEGRVLEYVPDAAFLRRQAAAELGREHRLARDPYLARVGLGQARYGVENRRLAAAGGAEDRHPPGGEVGLALQREARIALGQAERQRGSGHLLRAAVSGGRVRAASCAPAESPPASAMETPARASAVSSSLVCTFW